MSRELHILQILNMRSVNNGIISYVFAEMDALAGRVRSDFVMVNEPEEPLKEHIRQLNGRLFVLNMRNRAPFRYMKRLSEIIREGNYDAVHAHGNSRTLLTEMTAARMAGMNVRIPHAHNTSCRQKALHFLLKPLFDRSYTAGAACGTAAGKFLFGERPFTVLKNGIDTERFAFFPEKREAARKSLGLEDRFVILHVGGFNDYKNQSFLLEPVRQAGLRKKETVMVFAGAGEEFERVRSEAKDGDLFRFLGSRRDVPDLLAAADLFVLPSLHEGFPISLIEAQASGLPCLVSNRVTRDVSVSGEVRFLPLSAGAWTEAILSSAPADPERRSSSAEAVRKAGYEQSDTAEALYDFYRSQIEDAGTGGRK